MAVSYPAPMSETPPSVGVELSAPDPGWRHRGAGIAAELLAALAPSARYVEHIGSTSIPGMAAKPVYDLQVSVADLGVAEAIFDGPLADRGFERSPYQRDHVPAYSDDDPARWEKRLWCRRRGPGSAVSHGSDTPDRPAVNLHVRLLGSPNERLALLFRDWFRAHPEAIAAYAEFKRRLAGVVPATGVYSDVKDPVVDLVMAVAEPWAATTGWAPHGITAP